MLHCFSKSGFYEWIFTLKYVEKTLQLMWVFTNQHLNFGFEMFILSRSAILSEMARCPVLREFFLLKRKHNLRFRRALLIVLSDSQFFLTNFSLISKLACSAHGLYFFHMCSGTRLASVLLRRDFLYYSFSMRIAGEKPNIHRC